MLGSDFAERRERPRPGMRLGSSASGPCGSARIRRRPRSASRGYREAGRPDGLRPEGCSDARPDAAENSAHRRYWLSRHPPSGLACSTSSQTGPSPRLLPPSTAQNASGTAASSVTSVATNRARQLRRARPSAIAWPVAGCFSAVAAAALCARRRLARQGRTHASYQSTIVPSSSTASSVWMTSGAKGWRAQAASSTSMPRPGALRAPARSRRPCGSARAPPRNTRAPRRPSPPGSRGWASRRRNAAPRRRRSGRADCAARRRPTTGFGHGGDLLGLEQAAAMADVGLDDADRAGARAVRRTRRGRPAARRSRAARSVAAATALSACGLAGRHRLLDEHRAAGRQRLDIGAAPPRR